MAHAARFDGALAQITRMMSTEDGDTADRRLFHKNRGCCCATVISHLPVMKEEAKVKNNNNEGGKKRTAACIT